MRQRQLGGRHLLDHAAHHESVGGRGRWRRGAVPVVRRCRRGRRGTCRQHAPQAGFRIDQELRRGHHLLSRREPAVDHQLIAYLRAHLDLHGMELAGSIDHIGQCALAGADDRFAGNKQRGLFVAFERDLAGHAGLQALAGIGHFKPHSHRTGVAVGFGQDAHDARLEHFTGKRRQPDLRRLADLQWSALCFGDGRFDPHRGQAIHPDQAFPGGNRHALAHHQFGHQAALRCCDRVQPLGLACALHLGDQGLRHAEQQQPLAGSCGQRCVAHRANREKLALCGDPLRQQ